MKLYRGYIVFVFSVTMFVCVCLCVNFFFVKDFSGTTLPRILKFCTDIVYDLCCVRHLKSDSSCLSFPLFVHFFLSSIKYVATDFSVSMRARVFKFCIPLQRVEEYFVKENHAEIYFALCPFFHLSLQCNV